MEKLMFNEREAAVYLGLSPATLATWRSRGGGPCFVRYSSRCIRYDRVELDEFKRRRMARNTKEETEAERETDA